MEVGVTLTENQASFISKDSIFTLSESLRPSSGLGLDSDSTYSGFSLDSLQMSWPPLQPKYNLNETGGYDN